MVFPDSLQAVEDQHSFLVFVEALQRDKQLDHPTEPAWTNTTIESFLEAAVAWAKDTAFGKEQGFDSAPPWRQLAAFFYAGRNYGEGGDGSPG